MMSSDPVGLFMHYSLSSGCITDTLNVAIMFNQYTTLIETNCKVCLCPFKTQCFSSAECGSLLINLTPFAAPFCSVDGWHTRSHTHTHTHRSGIMYHSAANKVGEFSPFLRRIWHHPSWWVIAEHTNKVNQTSTYFQRPINVSVGSNNNYT